MTTRIHTFEEYQDLYAQSVADPEGFWAEQADTFQWHQKWDKVLDWNFRKPDINWFPQREAQYHRKLPRPAPGHAWRPNSHPLGTE